MLIDLPISKSIANRLLILQQLYGDELMPVSDAMPGDVRRLYDVLRSHPHRGMYDLDNDGTAFRFLTAYFAQLPGAQVTLTGCERMLHRPIGQLVEALRSVGAEILYLLEEGYPPIYIEGKALARREVELFEPISTQFISALLLIGCPVASDIQSPYIDLTEWVIQHYPMGEVERDWSSAAFWYEYVAIHGGELVFPHLYMDSVQGDRVVMDVFRRLGVETDMHPEGLVIRSSGDAAKLPDTLEWNFKNCPDLYPAVALACERLHVPLQATGTESLPYKESDRLYTVAHHIASGDHRVAMALLAADYEVDDIECIDKSYPQFVEQLCAFKQSSQEKE